MLKKNISKFQRRSLQLFSASILCTAFLTMYTHEHFSHHSGATTGLSAWVIALLPSLPFLGTIYLCLHYLRREKDEYIRSQVLLALLQGAFITLAATVIYAFLENSLNITSAPAMFYIDLFLIASMVTLRIHLRNSQ